MEFPFRVLGGGQDGVSIPDQRHSPEHDRQQGEITEKILGQRPKAFLEQKVNNILSMCKS
jgi:hypothetical protein